jgi:adenine-specific DNA-methyltransferase
VLVTEGASSKREDRPNLFYPIYYDPTTDTLSLDEIQNYIKIIPKLSDGSDGNWRWGKQKILQSLDKLLVKKVTTRNEYDIFEKVYLEQEGEAKRTKAKSIWLDSRYSSDFATTAYKKIMGNIQFKNPKSPELIKDIINLASQDDDIIVDFFTGSGTTAHSVLALNKEDGGNRKYIMVDMGEYFDSIIKPRIEKLMYCFEWDEAKSQSADGISHIFKYQTLEQYDDTLKNIEFTESGTFQRTLADMNGYFLRYMLDFETRESPCRFNVTKLEHPFSYTLKITESNKLKEQTVDLVETFNYLLGLHVKKIRTFINNGTYYRVVLSSKEEDDIAVIWRDTENLDLKEDKSFIEGTILSEFNPAKTYINADFYVEGAHPIEPEFKRLMVG